MKIASNIRFVFKILAAILLGIVLITSGLLGIYLALCCIFGLFLNHGMSVLVALVACRPLSISYVAYGFTRQLFGDPSPQIKQPKVSNAEAFKKIL
jgi:hypothetical protein